MSLVQHFFGTRCRCSHVLTSCVT